MQKNSLYIGVIISLFFLNTLSAQNEDWQWAKRGGGVVSLAAGSEIYSTGLERIVDMDIDSNNNYYFLAEIGVGLTDYDGSPIQTYSSNDSRKDIFVFSTDCSGNFRWSKTIGGSIDDFAISLGVDANNNVYVSGYTSNIAGSTTPPHFDTDSIKPPATSTGVLDETKKNAFIIKYDDQGNFQWLREPEGAVADVFTAFMQYTFVESNGRTHSLIKFTEGTHLEGQLTVPPGELQSVIVVYDSNGNLEDFITIDMQPGFDWYDYQLTYDATLNRYYIADTKREPDHVLSINGFGQSSGDSKSFYLAALDDQGQVLWYHENQRAQSWTLGDLTLDNNGNIYFTGVYFDNEDANGIGDSFAGYDFVHLNGLDPSSPFLVKLDPSGNLLCGTNATGSNRFPGRSIAISGNDVYLGLGSLNNVWDGMPFGNEVSGVGQFSTDNAVLRFNKTSGSLEEVIAMPGTGFDMIMAMAIDSQDNIVVGGHFGSSLLDSDPALSVFKAGGDTDFFVAQYGQDCSLGVNENANNFSIKLYPQPADQVVKLQSGVNLESYKIYNLTGQLLQEGKVHQASINIGDLPQGLYVIRIIDRSQNIHSKRLIVK